MKQPIVTAESSRGEPIMIECTKRDDISPMCPHCSSQLRTVWFQQLAGVMGKRFVYFCGTCRKVLGVSHRKGFWMG
jgi:hypothetical protein